MAIYTVSQVTTYVNEVLSYDDVLRDIWVEGEIANVARPASGHAYFTLRDGTSSLRCVMFRNSRGMEHILDGAAIIAHGRLAVYEVLGDLQLIADIAQPEGAGELQLKLEQLKLKLETEGLFEPSRKRKLPTFPRKIGVVSSPTGAVWHDIQDVIGRRYPLVELMLAPAPVQGETAAPAIAEAVQAANDEPDLDAYYRDKVIGGPGAFVEIADTIDDFARAMRVKLLREIEYRPVVGQLAAPPAS